MVWQKESQKISEWMEMEFFFRQEKEKEIGNVGEWTWENALRSTEILKIGIDYRVLAFKRFHRTHLSQLHYREVLVHVLP